MREGEVVGGRFIVERLAGHGGMGAVYRARDGETGERVAIKTLFDRDPESLRRFAREAALLGSVRHPNVVRYLAHEAADDAEPWLAMEWVEGESLEQRLSGRGVTADEAIALVRQAADALGAAHARGIVHRDLKPSNLMLADGDVARVKLLDFGVARGADRSALTQTGAIVGSAFYMSPEQARGERDVDARADVFALGCVLFRGLTGRLPFDGPTAPSVLLRIVLDEAPDVAALRPDLPAALIALVARLLAKSRDDRLADGAAVAGALAALGTVGDPDAAPRSLERGALTAAERKIAALVLARPPAPDAVAGDGTRLLAQSDPELRAAIARHGGALEILADGTLVVAMPADGAVTDRAERAARCALATRSLARVEAVAVTLGEHEVTGRAAVGALIDAGLQLLDAPTEFVRLDRRLAPLLERHFDVGADALGAVLRGERAEGAATGALLGRQVPCFGRDAELAMLEALAAHAFDEPAARAAVVIAPAGVGKSRLARELVARLAARPAPPEIWLARGDALRTRSPFGLLAPLLRARAGVLEGEPASGCEAKLTAYVARSVAPSEVAAVTEFLAALAAIPLASPPSAELVAARESPLLLADRIRRAFVALVRAEVARRPLLLVLEDLHWGDLPTVKAVDAMLEELAGAPILVVALARPELAEAFPRLFAGRDVQTIQLRELGRRPSERLVRAALGADAGDEIVGRIVDRAAGNAFFLEELVRAEVAGSGGALPETVLATLEARLGALDVEARRVLRAASVFGEVFWRGGVLALLGAGGATPSPAKVAACDDWLRSLEDGEFVLRRHASRFPGEVELGFRHALVREAAHAMLTDADRELGHRLAGAWLEANGEPDLAMLANHFERGGDLARAAHHHLGAARVALGSDDVHTAIASARRAVTCAGAEADATLLRGEARLVELEALRYAGEPAAQIAIAEEAMALLPRGSDPYFGVVGERVTAYYHVGRPLEPSDVLAALVAPPVPGANGARAFAIARSAQILLFTGHGALADEVLGGLAAIDEDDLDLTARAMIARTLGVAAKARQDVEEQVRHFGRARRFHELAGDRRGAGLILTDLSALYSETGRFEDALALGEEVVAVASRGLGFLMVPARVCVGRALAGLGELDRARASLEAAAAIVGEGANAPVLAGLARIHLSLVLFEVGDFAAAEREARAAAEVIAHVAVAVAGPLAVLARALLAQGRGEEAETAARRAAANLAGGSNYAPLARLVLAEIVFSAGRVDEARAVLADARARLLAESTRIRDPRMRQSFLERVPEHARTIALAAAWVDG